MKFKLTFWKVVFGVIMVLGMYSMGVRYFQGIGAVSNLSDQFPWGIWIGFDCLCGVMLAAGAFVVTGVVYLLDVKRLHAIARPAVLTAFLGYVLFIVGLLVDLGRPWYIWHQLIYMNPHSVMFEVGMCVMTYTTVLMCEFSAAIMERFDLVKPLKIIKACMIPLVIAGVLLSTLHQSSLGSLYLILPEKLHPFWYSPALPFFFFISAACVGLAMTIFESSVSSRAFGRQLELPIIVELGGYLYVCLWVYALLRFQDYYHRDQLRNILHPSYESYFLWAELLMALIIPLAMLSFRKVRLSGTGLYVASCISLLGFITNRLNVGITALEGSSGMHYHPKWTEASITAMIVAMGFFIFAMAVKYLPIFEDAHHHETPLTVQAHQPVELPVETEQPTMVN
ncbi:MAG TPA: Ni/Fe-hydrogenase cytochrome b subunit [Candidatus Saccharimonadales bacterium]|nr:Ni/Fe-hydrogenase cytochrome b subunit [Candidatus Saccharimonadales bacterium]